MLAARWRQSKAVSALGERWRRDAGVRVSGALVEAEAARFLGGCRAVDHLPRLRFDVPDAFQLWRFPWVAGTDCDHTLCRLGRWLWGPCLEWVQDLTGLELAADPERQLVSDSARKGSFFEAYDDAGGTRAVAFQLHLTPAPWPATWGGHLERLATPKGPVIDRWPSAWNALDLFDVRAGGSWRHMPLLTRHVEGYVVSGWYHLAAPAPPMAAASETGA